MEDHLLLNDIANTYDKWIYHGEPLYVDPTEAQPHHDDDDDDIDFIEFVLQENVGLKEDGGYKDDRIPDLLKDLYNSKDHDNGQKSMIVEVKRQSVQLMIAQYLHREVLNLKSFYRIKNVAFSAICRILTFQFPNSLVPKYVL